LSGTSDQFDLYSICFHFEARGPFTFPALLTGNIFRGALGSFLQSANRSAYLILFGGGEQIASPRPFVLRCRSLAGRNVSPGEIFSLQLNLFLPTLDLLPSLEAACIAMSEAGFGPERSRAKLLSSSEHIKHSLRLNSTVEPAVRAIRIHFRTPTELKSNGKLTGPEDFSTLIGQICHRLVRLNGLYGSGKLELHSNGLRKLATAANVRSTDLRRVEVSRRGTRSGQTHPLGGFLGSIDLSGDLGRFIPLLDAASFVGVGRHTVWGNGEIAAERLE
jgi:hypothetical protein